MKTCVWRVGSSNKKTGKSELPERCKKMKCPDGTFRNTEQLKKFQEFAKFKDDKGELIECSFLEEESKVK